MSAQYGFEVDSSNALASSGTTYVNVSSGGTNSPSLARPQKLFAGDYSASPFLTLQAALDSISKNRQHRALITIATGTYVGAQMAAFVGNIGIDTLNTSLDLLVKDAVVVKGTNTLATLTTGDNTGTAGPGTTTQVIQKPTISANYTATNLANRLFVITGGGGASTDPDVPAMYVIASNTTTSFTLTRPAPGVDGTTTFQIINCGTTLTSRDIALDLSALDIVGCDAPIRIVGIKFDDVTNSFWNSIVRMSRKVTFYGCDFTNAIDTGVAAAFGGWIELDNCITRITATAGLTAQDMDKVVVKGLSSVGSLVSARDCRYVKVQGLFEGCADGAINVTDAQYAVIDATVNNSTVTVPVDIRNVSQGFFTSLTGTNAALVLQPAVNFGGSGQYYVNGVTITTGYAYNYTIESANPNTWASLSGYYQTDRRGNTVVTSDFTKESVQGTFQINGTFNALQDSNFGGKAIYYGYVYYPIVTAQTAYASGGQASATTLGLNTSVYTTVAENRASAKYAANLDIGGVEQLLFNDGLNTMNVYPPSDGFIDGLDVNTPIQATPRSLVIARTTTGGGTLRAFVLSEDFNPKFLHSEFEDFMRPLATFATAPFTVNSGTIANIPSETQTPGIIQLSTGGVSATGAATLFGDQGYYVDSGAMRYKARARLSAASSVGQAYKTYIGLSDLVDDTSPGEGIYFFHDENSANWFAVTNAAGTTSTDTTIAVAANQFYTLEIEIDADATGVQFFIDGVLVATHTANIPTAQTTALTFSMIKSVGTTARNLDVDYVKFDHYLVR